jgi:hypothetical protein
MENGYIVSKNTGEIVSDIYEGDRIVRASTVEFLKQTEVWNIESFFKGHVPELKKIMGELSTNEKAFILSIVPHIGYEDCCLKHGNNTSLDTEDFVKITGLSSSVLYRTLDTLIKKDIIYRGKNSKGKQFFVNPWLFCKGNRINKVLKAMFQNYKIRILNNVRWKDIKD